MVTICSRSLAKTLRQVQVGLQRVRAEEVAGYREGGGVEGQAFAP